MKKLLPYILLLLVTSISALDRRAELIVSIEKNIIAEIDSIEFIPISNTKLESNSIMKVTAEQTQYSFNPTGSKSVIVLKLKKKSMVRSQQIEMAGFEDNIYVTESDGKFFIGKKIDSKVFYNTLFFLVALVLILITKVPITMLLIKPKSIKDYLLKASGLNLIYLLLLSYTLVVHYKYITLIFFAIYLLMMVLDAIFYTKMEPDNKKTRAIIAAVLSNLLFITLGQFAFFMIAFYSDSYF